jgi:hypothetical protein
MDNTGIQERFFKLLKQKIPEHISLADELATVLNISDDSAYRRLRGDKQIGFDELQLLCQHFRISIDQMLGLQSHNVIFSGRYIRPENFNFTQYLQAMLEELRQIRSAKKSEVIFLCKDFPIYHYFVFPEIAAFKYFSWMKTLLNFSDYKSIKFSLPFMREDFEQIGKKLAETYYQIPGTEILNPDNILTTLRQIEYYKDAKLFENADDLSHVYDSLMKMVDHVQQMATEGKKFIPGKDPSVSPGEYKLYVNDFYVGDNTLLVRKEDTMSCYIVHSGTNYIKSEDNGFCNYQATFIQNIIKRSSYISVVGEKERGLFFQMIRERISMYRENKVQTLGNY